VPPKKRKEEEKDVKRDFSLKVGEMITIDIGSKGRRMMARSRARASRVVGHCF